MLDQQKLHFLTQRVFLTFKFKKIMPQTRSNLASWGATRLAKFRVRVLKVRGRGCIRPKCLFIADVDDVSMSFA
jgi:hypothetical protein